MTSSRLRQRAVLIYLTLAGTFVGVWAAMFPRAFYDDFPGFGRAWVAADGPMNEHLVRDVGQLSLALSLVSLVAAISMERLLIRTAAAAWLLAEVPHFAYHVRHLGLYATTDKVGNVVSLGALVLLPLGTLVASWREGKSPAPPEATSGIRI